MCFNLNDNNNYPGNSGTFYGTNTSSTYVPLFIGDYIKKKVYYQSYF